MLHLLSRYIWWIDSNNFPALLQETDCIVLSDSVNCRECESYRNDCSELALYARSNRNCVIDMT